MRLLTPLRLIARLFTGTDQAATSPPHWDDHNRRANRVSRWRRRKHLAERSRRRNRR
ncbi:hypothetical protein [Limnoglobus roseus]|uniref:Uncharacterized protein n=1 Tax=Limnoglobus roseus TaxID=2598579 RepID=A0A5C1AKQ2_9BACT|nr:hypothetical protein [Limnoglobus roseus]QEL18292.1 hypothetical protein PX52LOC_05311 [Limnoglobus roseus]